MSPSHPPFTRALAPLALILLISSPLHASTDDDFDAIHLPLEKLLEVQILSTPKFAGNPDQIPSAVSILTREDIRTYGWKTLSDALRSLQGFNVTNDHTYHYSGIRGIAAPSDFRPRLQILIDGMPSNENLYDGAQIDSSLPIDLDLIERIEVVRGPSASVYGSNAMFGVINLVTRSTSSLNGAEAAMAIGSGGARSGRVSGGGKTGDTEWMLSASRSQVDGFDLYLPGPDLNVGQADGEAISQVFLRVKGEDWRATLLHGERTRIVPTGSYDTIPGDPAHQEGDRFTLLDLGKDWHIDASTSLHQRIYAGAYAYDADFPYDTPPNLINHEEGKGTWWGLETLLISEGFTDQRWTYGLEIKVDSRQDMLNVDLGYGCVDVGAAPCLDEQHDHQRYSLFAQDEIELDRFNRLIVGLRYDHSSDYGGFWSPRLGYIHDARDLGIFKLLYGSAYRIPTVYERFYSTPVYTYGNPDLDNERLHSLELTWEQRIGHAGMLTSSLYHLEMRDMISTDSGGVASNDERTRANGLELEYTHAWNNGAKLRTGYSLQRASNDQGDLDNSPRQMAKLNLSWPLPMDWRLGSEIQWIDARAAASGTESVKAYSVVNLHFSQAPLDSPWEFGIGVQNLFDTAYSDPIAYEEGSANAQWSLPQRGRTFHARMVAKF